uniref:RING-type domain-containing protein n=1 Tax=Callorhinchus milii TaxID=7868 RepID=A0A4W3HVH0_CALMI
MREEEKKEEEEEEEEEEERDVLLVEEIHCPSCKRVYNIPVFLPCSHSVCKSCPGPSAKSASLCDVRCPVCKLAVELPSTDSTRALDYLRVNVVLQELVDGSTDAFHVGRTSQSASQNTL